ncbi:hypothetical protein AJ88_04605 [Mesorhizobium amorphae CCBAU 01583]|nr:hypothetical protein AJ88_04605 [Mesorhizobium amorphae CCBAU 01583]
MSRSARTPRSIAAPCPTPSSARAPRSTIWFRSPITSASAAIALLPVFRVFPVPSWWATTSPWAAALGLPII